MKVSLFFAISITSVTAVKRMLTPADYFKKNPDFLARRLNANRKLPAAPAAGGFGVHPEDRLTCDVIEEAFKTGDAWADSACACRKHDAFALTATCIDQFECCDATGTVCVTNSFQQVIDTKTYEPLDTMEYFHYTQGRVGTVTLYHLCDSGHCSCSLHANLDRCDSCQLIECDGEEDPMFDCSNVPGGAVFDFCPSSEVKGLNTTEVIGVMNDGYIDFENGCKPLPQAISANITNAIGHLHNLIGQHGSPAAPSLSMAFGALFAVSTALYMMF